MQEQDPAPFRSLHTALDPHGDGVQGVLGGSSTEEGRFEGEVKINTKEKRYFRNLID